MTAKDFPEVNVRIAEDQEQYHTLPAFFNSSEGSITVCFELNDDELNRMKATNELWLKIYTGGKALQPLHPSCLKEELIQSPPKITVIVGAQGTGKTSVLLEVARGCKPFWIKEQDCGILIMPPPDSFDHILIDDVVGTREAIAFINRWGKTHKVTIATQNPSVVQMLGKCAVFTLTR